MSKDPAFLFYSSDFLAGVSDLTMEERGQFITLLCIQHQKSGRLSRKAVALAVGNAAADVLAKFKEDENGLLFNERLEKEILKRKKHSEKQRQRAISGWKKRKEKKDAVGNAAALPLENGNENENINEIKEKGGVGEREETALAFESEKFREAFFNYKCYLMKSHGRSIDPFQQEAINRQISSMTKSEIHAIKILETNIANGWKTLNFVELDEKKIYTTDDFTL